MRSIRLMTCCDLPIALILAIIAMTASSTRAGGGPENVFLIVNANGAKSMEVANHFIALRNIPPVNVFYVRTPPNAHSLPAVEFRKRILEPALAEIEKRKLKPQIDYLVYSCEFPWQIDFTPVFGDTKLAQPNPTRPRLSLTAATYLHQLVLKDDRGLLQLNSNKYYAVAGEKTSSQGFRSEYQWTDGAQRVSTGGAQYLLSVSLGFTQPDCSTVAEILDYLRRAAAADGTHPRGTFYFMDNPDVRARVRRPAYPAAIAELKALGQQAEIARGVVPTGKTDILGLTTGSARVRLGTGDCELLPGSLVDNLTSLGGALWPITRPTQQTRVTEYMRLGAAGASGTVIEPLAIPAKFPSPALHVHYARGCTMAEAFYQSIQGPFQMLLVGDPLCRPFASIPKVSVKGVDDNGIVSGLIELQPSATVTMPAGASAEPPKIDHFELFVDGIRREKREPGQSFILDTSKMADGYHELRVVAIDDSPIETQGRWIAGVLVKNGADSLQLVADDRGSASGEISVQFASTRDGPAAIVHNGREVIRFEGRQGRVTIPTTKVGAGPVTLQARALGGVRALSRPITVDVR